MSENIYSYMLNLPVEGDACGIDASTITATGMSGKVTLNLIMESLRDTLAVEKKIPFKFNGASGFSCGSIRYADKYDERKRKLWAILMVTGKDSEKVLRQGVAMGDVKFTRCDLYVDIMLKEKVLGLPRKLKESYKGDSQIKLIESLTGDTLYVGSRQSESMLRIYDKSPDYKMDLGYVWRFEVEYKGALADLVATSVAREGDKTIPEFVFGELHHKSLPSPRIEQRPNIKGMMITLSSAEMKLDWISRQVAPTVRHLRSLGLENEVIRALQLDLPLDIS